MRLFYLWHHGKLPCRDIFPSLYLHIKKTKYRQQIYKEFMDNSAYLLAIFLIKMSF